MGSYISRCLNPPTKAGTVVGHSGAPAPENGVLAATSTQSAEGPSAATTQVVGPASPGAASPETAAPDAPALEGVGPTPRVDTGMSIPISIADSDDGTPKGPAGGNISAGPKPIAKPDPRKPEDPLKPKKPKPGDVKQRFRLPFGGKDEE